MNDRLVLLGSKGGPALRPGGPWPTSSLLELGGRTIVVDCGLGVTRGLVDAGISLKALDLIFITHLHSDHVLELGPLLHTAWTAGLANPVALFGPPGTSHYWRRFCQAMEFDIEIRIVDEGRPDIRDLVSIVEFGEGEILAQRGLKVSALRVDHPPVTDCFALRFDHDGKSVVFSADTAFFPPLAGSDDGHPRSRPRGQAAVPPRRASLIAGLIRAWRSGAAVEAGSQPSGRAAGVADHLAGAVAAVGTADAAGSLRLGQGRQRDQNDRGQQRSKSALK